MKRRLLCDGRSDVGQRRPNDGQKAARHKVRDAVNVTRRLGGQKEPLEASSGQQKGAGNGRRSKNEDFPRIKNFPENL